MRTYTEVLAQIEQLKAEADKLYHRERNSVIHQVRGAMRTYHITFDELSMETPSEALEPAKQTRKARQKPAEKIQAERNVLVSGLHKQVRYDDRQGNTWSGMGHHPKWLKEYMGKGGKLKDLLVAKT